MNSIRHFCLIASVFALMLYPASLARPQSSEADELNGKVLELYRAGKFSEAIPLARQVLATWEKVLGRDHPAVATALNNLATLYNEQGDYAEAEPLYKRALTIYEKALAPDHPDVARVLSNLATLYKEQGRYAEAEPLYKRALAIDEKALGPDDTDVATDLNALAELYRAEGQYAQAETLHKRSQAILREKAAGRVAQAPETERRRQLEAGRQRQVEAERQRQQNAEQPRLEGARPKAVAVPPASTIPGRGISVPASPPAPRSTVSPLFPWPPPAASASYVLPRDLFKNRSTIGQAVAAIVAALESRGYVDRSFFATPAGGVALVTRLERINDDGSHAAESQRWPTAGKDQQYGSSLDLAGLLRGLFFTDPGRYRIIVFIMQNEVFAQSDARISEEDARAWLRQGLNTLPPELEDRTFDKGDCTALIYEFVSAGGGVHTVESQLTGKQHLRMAGLEILLEEKK
jgi:tetratricopeptide (TPR) repeat protein